MRVGVRILKKWKDFEWKEDNYLKGKVCEIISCSIQELDDLLQQSKDQISAYIENKRIRSLYEEVPPTEPK